LMNSQLKSASLPGSLDFIRAKGLVQMPAHDTSDARAEQPFGACSASDSNSPASEVCANKAAHATSKWPQPGFMCAVCFETRDVAADLPCCNIPSTATTRYCIHCIRSMCLEHSKSGTGRCPNCRTTLQFEDGELRIATDQLQQNKNEVQTSQMQQEQYALRIAWEEAGFL